LLTHSFPVPYSPAYSGQITRGLLEQAKALGVPSLWLQPGAADDEIAEYIKETGLEDRVIYGGPCVLLEGDDVLKSL
jgi:predicted CoA-binding protein